MIQLMEWSVRRWIAAFAFAIFLSPTVSLAEAAAAGGDEAKPAATMVCEVNARECTPEGARICRRVGEGTVWSEINPCTGSQTCQDGTCSSKVVTVLMWSVIIGLFLAFIGIIISYAKGLKGSPRELYMLFMIKVIEYTAYGAMQMTFVLFLSDLAGLSDIEAGSYIAMWALAISLVTLVVGAVVDAIGIKRTLLIGTISLVVARAFLPFVTDLWLVTILGFIPMAIGTAVMAPVISVGIKRYTTKEGAALGFGLFYTLMNVGWAAGGWLFDYMRVRFGEHGHTLVPVIDVELHTYQLIFLVGFVLSLPTLIMVLMMRNGVDMTEDGMRVAPKKEKQEGNPIAIMLSTMKTAAVDTGRIMKSVFMEKAFWTFMFMIAVLIGVRLVFLHFHYTFPKYGIRVLGEGAKIGSIYGVLNPVIIVFLVPIVATLTKRVSSYKMIMIGTFLSAISVFVVTLPEQSFAWMNDTFLSELVYDRWLDVMPSEQRPLYMGLIVFITIFTIGEAFWSPRFMQFTAEIAPEGKEGTYLSLAILPMFLAKFVAGPLSGWLVATYTPMEDGVVGDTSQHYMVWVWIGAMAITSPIGLVIFKKMFTAAEAKKAAEG